MLPLQALIVSGPSGDLTVICCVFAAAYPIANA
jgi:hypothetical protein